MNKFSQIEETQKFKEIHDIFEKIFRGKNFYLEDQFKSDVFFMSEDVEFLTMTSVKATPNAIKSDSNLMYKILESSSENGSDFKKLKVNVKDFIKLIVFNLIELQQQKETISEKIKNFDIDETLNIIEHTLANPPSATSTQITPNLKVSITRMDDFPAGEYSFKLHFDKLRFVSKGVVQSENSSSQIFPTIKKDKSVLDLKDRVKDFTFQSQNLIPIEINYNDYKDNEKIMKLFSGTNLTSFELEITEKGGTKYFTPQQEVLDIFLKSTKYFFTDTLKHSTELNLKFNTFKQDESSISHNLICSLLIEIDFPVRKSILERIYYIFKNTISFRTLVETNLKSLLRYFPNHFDTLTNILNRQDKEERSACGECGCRVF
jgi:hypothetical protein